MFCHIYIYSNEQKTNIYFEQSSLIQINDNGGYRDTNVHCTADAKSLVFNAVAKFLFVN